MTATVFNNSDRPADYVFTSGGKGCVTVDSAEPRTGSLAPGASALITYAVRAGERVPGEKNAVAFVFSIPSAGQTVECEEEILVRPANPPVTRFAYKRLNPGESAGMEFFADGFTGAVTGECKAAASPAVILAGPLEWLRDYPYGCLEQTSSAALPFIASPELFKIGAIPDETEAATLALRVDRAVSRVERCRDGTFGFSMWPDGGCDWKWEDAGLHAAAFLAEASRRPGGRPLHPDTVRWLENIASTHESNPAKAGTPEQRLRLLGNRERRAFASWILARAGRDTGMNAARQILARERGSLAAFMAAAALVEGGYASEGASEIRAFVSAGGWRNKGETSLFGGSSAPVCGFAMSVLAELPKDFCGGNEEGLVWSLMSAKMDNADKNLWGGTFNNAWAVYGLARFVARDMSGGAASPSPAAIAYCSGAPFAFTNASSGAVWICGRTSGVPLVPEADTGDLELVRRYRNLSNRPDGRILHGDIVEISIEVCGDTLRKRENLVLTDLVPAGFEIEDPALATRSGAGRRTEGDAYGKGLSRVRTERRDDRAIFFFDTWNDVENPVFKYRVRAVTRGRFGKGAASLGAMYDPSFHAVTRDSGVLVVE